MDDSSSGDRSEFISVNNESGDEAKLGDKLDWVQELQEALQCGNGFENIQRICNHKFVPDDLRADFLRVRFSTKGQYVKLQEIFDLPQQSTIRSDCQQLINGLNLDSDEQLSLISRLECILTTFSKSHCLPYHNGNGWLEVLRILLPLKLEPKEVYIVFEKIVLQLVPNCFVYDKSTGRQLHNPQPFAFLRLLLQYHDPELCSYLDTRKITPDAYAISWLRSLFAAHASIKIIQCFWDIYFQVNDPFMVFYIALVMLINVKEQLMELREEPKEKVVAFLKQMPDNFQTEDIGDLFYIIEQHYIPNTPRSIHEYIKLLFNKTGDSGRLASGDDDGDEDDDVNDDREDKSSTSESMEKPSSLDLSQMLCLPVHIPYLVSCCSSPTLCSMRFFIVDCRPAEQYNNGHLSTAFHLDCSLMLQEPSSFSTAVQALLASQAQAIEVGSLAGGKHLCFLGSGREEEDRYLNMVIAFFLQKKQNFVSVAHGGYELLHKHLSDQGLLKVNMLDHNRRYCLPCAKMDSIRSISSNAISKHASANHEQSLSERKSSASGSSFFSLPNSLSQTFSSFNKNLQLGLSRDSSDTKHSSKPSTTTTTTTTTTDITRHDHNQEDWINRSGDGESLFEKMATTLKSKSSVMKEKLIDMIAQNNSSSSSSSSSLTVQSKHVSSDKLGKRYNPKNFSLVDDELNGSDDESNLEIEVESWCKQNHAIGHFRCQELKDNGVFYPSFLILTSSHLYIFREIPHNRGYAKIVAKRPLEMLVQITSKKKYPELITFRYGQTAERQEDHPNIITSDHLLIPRQYEVTRLIKQQTIKILDSDTNTTAFN